MTFYFNTVREVLCPSIFPLKQRPRFCVHHSIYIVKLHVSTICSGFLNCPNLRSLNRLCWHAILQYNLLTPVVLWGKKAINNNIFNQHGRELLSQHYSRSCTCSSASTSHLQEFVGRSRSLFLQPWGIMVRAWRVKLDGGFLYQTPMPTSFLYLL